MAALTAVVLRAAQPLRQIQLEHMADDSQIGTVHRADGARLRQRVHDVVEAIHQIINALLTAHQLVGRDLLNVCITHQSFSKEKGQVVAHLPLSFTARSAVAWATYFLPVRQPSA